MTHTRHPYCAPPSFRALGPEDEALGETLDLGPTEAEAQPTQNNAPPKAKPQEPFQRQDMAAELDSLIEIEGALESRPEEQEEEEDGNVLDTAEDEQEEEGQEEEEQEEEGEVKKHPEPKGFKTNRELRKAYGDAKTKIASLEAELRTLQESRQDNQGPLAERVRELESQLSRVDYKNSPEFKSKYVAPLSSAIQNALEDIQGFEWTDDNEQTHKVTAQDFNAIVQAPLAEAGKLARKLFGDSSATILSHRREILALKKAQKEALEHADQSFEAFQEEEAAKYQLRLSDERKKLHGVIEAKRGELPAFYSPELSDELKPIAEKAQKLVDLIWGGDMSSLGEEQKRRIGAEAYLRTLNFPILAKKNLTLEKQVEDLKKELAQYKKGAPKGKPSGAPRKQKEKSLLEGLDDLIEQVRR